MAENNKIVFSIVQYLTDQLNTGSLTPDAKESLEVAVQCLESAYGISQADTHLSVNKSLKDIFQSAVTNGASSSEDRCGSPLPANKEAADKLRTEGNELMRSSQFEQALEKYTKAIKLDAYNPVHYCNRAAAHINMENFSAAVNDCKKATDFDPTYSRAYNRMGSAYTGLNKHKEAMDCYRRAVELEPTNENYRTNLSISEQKVQETAAPNANQPPNPFAAMAGAGGFDLGAVLNNPNLMSMATQMLSTPTMQNMMSNLMSGGLNQEGAGIDALLQAGQQLAQSMQASNPDLVEQLRQQMNRPGGGGSQPDSSGGGGSSNSKDQNDKPSQ